MKKIILIGPGGHSHACIDVIEEGKKYKIAGLIGKDVKKRIFGYPVLGTDEDLQKISKKIKNALISIGQIKNPKKRINLFLKAIKFGFKLPVIKSPHAYVSSTAKIGSGTIVMHKAVVNSNAKVGKNCIINTRSIVEHDVIVEDHCHISTGTILNGKVFVGKGSFIGSGSVIKENVKIGDNCLVGANVFLKKNLLSGTIYKKGGW